MRGWGALLVWLAPAAAAAGPVELVLGGDWLARPGLPVPALASKGAVVIVNLESPLAPCLPGGTVPRPRLCGDPREADLLRAAGVNAVTLANNHALDAGRRGLRATAARLRRARIVPLGVEAALTGRLRGERVGEITVVAANLTPPAHPPGAKVKRPDPAAIGRAVRAARAQGRPVLVLLHSGRELDPRASRREAAYVRAAVRAGASAVVMHGAHVIRPLYREGGVPVHLGLGNLRFHQRDRRARVGALLRLRLVGDGLAVAGQRCVDSLTARPAPCD